MECINCNNCKQNQPTYYCFARNDIVVNTNYTPKTEKTRTGWKKGHPNYETHRRKLRKSEIEV
ncbi:MAG: hypothetical protein GX918_09165 [Clostridiales bacterium]|nr:hypothetical protein [Clostridiales bacterium]